MSSSDSLELENDGSGSGDVIDVDLLRQFQSLLNECVVGPKCSIIYVCLKFLCEGWRFINKRSVVFFWYQFLAKSLYLRFLNFSGGS